MKPQSYIVSASSGGNSHSSIYRPDLHLTPFNISLGVIVSTSAGYTVQHTFDDLETTSAESATFFNHEFLVEASVSDDGNYAFPVTGIRLEVSAAASGGFSTLNLIQAGYANS